MKNKLFLKVLLFLLITSSISPKSRISNSKVVDAYSYVQEHAPQILTKNDNLKVRVLLQNLYRKPNQDWVLKIETKKGVIAQNQYSKILIKESTLLVGLANLDLASQDDLVNENLYIGKNSSNAKKIKDNFITLTPVGEYIVINGLPYNGKVSISLKNGRPIVINTVDLDDYIYSVIKNEIYQSWPLEMHKVQAIISRTYALHHILISRKLNKDYDIKSSNFHQSYGGYHPYEHLRKAIQETHNVIVEYDNKPALTMFDICCGGAIPALIKGIHFDKAPYLARKHACNYCKNYNLYSWKTEISFDEFVDNILNHSKLKPRLANAGGIKGIQILTTDKAGLVRKVKVNGRLKNIICSGKNILESMKDKIKSLSFNIKKNNNSRSLIISGKGYGHQVGLCQRGAYELVKKGWNFKEILGFYYPNTKLSIIEKLSEKKDEL